jgi:hypothetical protein
LDFVEDDRGRILIQKFERVLLIFGTSKVTNRCVLEKRCLRSVVLPDCLGPVTTIAGKVLRAFRMVLPNILGFMVKYYTLIFNMSN